MTSIAATAIRWMKFNLVGAIGIALQLAILFLLTHWLHFDYLVATVLAVELTVLHNFIWHERFTWAARVSHVHCRSLTRLIRFNASNGAISIGGNLLMMRLLVGEARLPALAANLLSIGACSIANFFISDRWVFLALS